MVTKLNYHLFKNHGILTIVYKVVEILLWPRPSLRDYSIYFQDPWLSPLAPLPIVLPPIGKLVWAQELGTHPPGSRLKKSFSIAHCRGLPPIKQLHRSLACVARQLLSFSIDISIVHWLFSAKYSHYLPAGPACRAPLPPSPLAETSEERNISRSWSCRPGTSCIAHCPVLSCCVL